MGAPKTGSTYLQKRIRAATALLRSHGVYFPVLSCYSAMAGNAKLLPVAIDNQASDSFIRVFPTVDIERLSARRVVADLVDDWRPRDEALLLSAENFRAAHAPVLRKLLPRDADCTVVLFIRRQDDWVDSYFNQLTKTRDINDDIDSFVGRICSASDGRICCPDWYMQYSAWQGSFGACRVVLYEEATGDLFGALIRASGLGPIPMLPEIQPTQVSLGAYQLTYLLDYRMESYPEFIRRRAASQEAARRLSQPAKRSLLSPRSRRLLRERFSHANERLMATLGRPNDAALLRISPQSERYACMSELRATDAYMQFRNLADTLYAAHTSFRGGVTTKPPDNAAHESPRRHRTT